MTELRQRPHRSVPLIIGGVISVLFGVFHLAFWRVFDWDTTLAPLSAENRAIMEVLNVHIAYTILVLGCLSIFRSRELLGTRLGRALTFFVAGFWILRAVNEVIFFESPLPQVGILLVAFVGTALLYVIPAWRARSNTWDALP